MPAHAPGRLAVIIPVYGQEQLTWAVLRDVAREPWVDVIVVDNRGDFHLDVPGHVLYPEVNLGWAGGCNFALRWLIEHGKHEVFVLLNNDTRLSRGFFRQLYKSWRRTSAWLLGPVYDGVWPTQRFTTRVPSPNRSMSPLSWNILTEFGRSVFGERSGMMSPIM